MALWCSYVNGFRIQWRLRVTTRVTSHQRPRPSSPWSRPHRRLRPFRLTAARARIAQHLLTSSWLKGVFGRFTGSSIPAS